MAVTLELVRPAVKGERDTLALDTAADRGEFVFLRNGGQQLVVLAEGQVLDRRARGKRDAVELDLDPAARAAGDIAGVHGEPVRDVRQRVGVGGEAAPLREPDRRTDEPACAERRSRGAERSRY